MAPLPRSSRRQTPVSEWACAGAWLYGCMPVGCEFAAHSSLPPATPTLTLTQCTNHPSPYAPPCCRHSRLPHSRALQQCSGCRLLHSPHPPLQQPRHRLWQHGPKGSGHRHRCHLRCAHLRAGRFQLLGCFLPNSHGWVSSSRSPAAPPSPAGTSCWLPQHLMQTPCPSRASNPGRVPAKLGNIPAQLQPAPPVWCRAYSSLDTIQSRPQDLAYSTGGSSVRFVLGPASAGTGSGASAALQLSLQDSSNPSLGCSDGLQLVDESAGCPAGTRRVTVPLVRPRPAQWL